jgi:AcrR family transcriptional regulator
MWKHSGGYLRFATGFHETAMTDTTTTVHQEALARRPRRADARRNYEKLLAAATEAFTEDGTAASLEDIARRAGVGIGTLYRNFPTRQALLEAVYIDEVEEMSRSAADLANLEPWEALVTWLRRYVGFANTKRALAKELLETMDQDAEVFAACRGAIMSAGTLLLGRAQDAGAVRRDVAFLDVARMVSGIAAIPIAEPGQIDRILDVALDGLRYKD